MKIEAVMEVIVVTLLITTPAIAGGYMVIDTAFNHSNTEDDEYLKALFLNHRFISGTGPSSEWNETLESNVVTELTNFNANFTDENAYFANTRGKYTLQLGKVGEVPSNKSVNVNTYIIMPGKFDAIQNIDMHFLGVNLTQVDVTTNLTWKGKTYEFKSAEIKKDDTSTFNMALYPFCEEFERIGLTGDMSSTFDEALSSGGMDYSGGFTITAVKD